jgi:RES domain
VLETKSPPEAIFRVARKPDPWQAPDWSRANPDGTFGNRFDDPEGYYRVLYAASQKLSCFLETLARYRRDLALLAELNEIEGEDDFVPLGTVPSEWPEGRLLGTALIEGDYADPLAAEWIVLLRQRLAGECLRVGLQDLDASVLQGPARRITQLASLEVRRHGCDGIYYRSRHGRDLENWALFEPFRIKQATAQEIAIDDPAFLEALRILGLKLAD